MCEDHARFHTLKFIYIYIYIYLGESKFLQYFHNMRHYSTVLDVSMMFTVEWTTLDHEMPILPDTLWILHTRLVSVALSTSSKSMVLCLPDLAWSSNFLEPEKNFLNHTVINCAFTFPTKKVLDFFPCIIVQFELVKQKLPK